MKTHELKTSRFPTLQLVDAEFAQPETSMPTASNEQVESKLLECLRSNAELDSEARTALEQGIANETELERLWFLLASLEFAPRRTVDTELVFSALCRLLDSNSPLMRFSAYRWLAGLYRIDLRFENRAKLKLRDALVLERGLMQERVRMLLTSC